MKKNYRIKVEKEDPADSGILELRDLLGLLPTKQEIKALRDSSPLFEFKKDMESLLDRVTKTVIRLDSGIVNVNAPISLRSNPEVEKLRSEEGLMYYDTVNKRWRRSTLTGWENA